MEIFNSFSIGEAMEKPLPIGSRVRVRFANTDEGHMAKITALKQSEDGNLMYYIHYEGFNKRLDHWVSPEMLDTSDLCLPTANGAQAKANSETPEQDATSSAPKKCGRKKKKVGRKSKRDANNEETVVGDVIKAKRQSKRIEPPPEIAVACVKNIKAIEIGRHRILPWYFSPYPEELCSNECIFICEFCLKYCSTRATLQRHSDKCHEFERNPPGTEIYRNNGISFFEVDAEKAEKYAQNLCLLSKLFLDHKTLFYDTVIFMFYVMTRNDDRGCHIVGYFSKEKKNAINNLSCILTLPCYQRMGYGKLLIEFSYELSKREHKTGTPEKPLSDLGLLAYQAYWAEAVINVVHQLGVFKRGTTRPTVSIDVICQKTGMAKEDVTSTLTKFNLVQYLNGQQIIKLNAEAIERHLNAMRTRKVCIDPKCLQWQPKK